MTRADEIEASLLEDRRECIEHDEPGPTDAAIATCKRLVDDLGDLLDRPAVLCAAFGSDNGEVSLVIEPPNRIRRLDLRILARGYRVHAISIDENTKATTQRLARGARDAIRERVEWVLG